MPTKCFKIDVVKQTIEPVDISGLDDIYAAIEAKCFDAVRIEKRDYIFVDDTGLLNGAGVRLGMFEVEGYPQPLAGHGLVQGCSRYDGEAQDVAHTLDELRTKIRFISADEARKKYC